MNESVNGINENEEKLIINIGEAYRPVVENYERAKESMFKPIYEKGRNLVKEICEAYDDKNSTNECNTNSENYNNIIAFIGERGSGKTSSMLTFSNLLNNEEFLRSGLSKKAYDKDRIEFKFVQNDVIDPSQFDKNVNILEIILAGMFKNFKNKADKIESTDRQIIIECFDKVYRNLKTLKKESNSIYDGEVLEALLEMSASMEIKENLSKLIAVYLEKVETTSNKNSILVIRIDDIDLNTEHAHSMVEQLRKYLMLPRVIILMALKIDQLHDVVNQTHYISLAELAKMEKNDGSTNCISINDKVIDMTEKYLSKLFPIDHRLLMPEPAIFSSSKKFQINMKIENKTIVENYPSLDYGIRELIYKKTGLHFIKPDKNENPIVPSNLRDLVNFVHYLKKFEDVKITSKEKLVRCMNAIIGNGSGNKILDDEIQKKLQANGKTLEDFSWFLDCPLTEDNDDWKVLCEEKKNYNRKKSNKDDLSIFNIIEDDVFTNLKNELNLINEYENNNTHVANKQLLKFKNYFISYWCQNKISKEGQSLIKRFLELDNKRKNKFIISELEKIFNIIGLWENQRENMLPRSSRFDSKKYILQKIDIYIEEYKKIYSVINYDANISVGDVFLVIDMLEKLNISNEVQNLIFAIKTIYYIELEYLNAFNLNADKKELLQEIDSLIGGEYFSFFQKKLIADDAINLKSRSLRDCKLSKIRAECESLKDNKNISTILFMSLMFNRTGNISENYRIGDDLYYDVSENRLRKYDNYVLSITSPFFNSYKVNNFIDSRILFDSIVSLNNMEKCISNIILLEFIFMEKVGAKKLTFTNPENITVCWYEFYESLNSTMRFFDEISYFSIFNMNFMKIFRKSDIKSIDISEDTIDNQNILDKLVESMEVDNRSRKNLQNYWDNHYSKTKKDISISEEMNLDILNNYITEMNFFKLNKQNTSYKFKQDLIDILKALSNNKTEDIETFLSVREAEWLKKNPDQENEYAKKYLEDGNYFYHNEKNYNKSLNCYIRALRLKPNDIDIMVGLANNYYCIYDLNKNEMDIMNAINYYKKALLQCDVLGIKLGSEYNEYCTYWLAKSYTQIPSKENLIKSIEECEKYASNQQVTDTWRTMFSELLSECKKQLTLIESQTEEPTETNLENLEPEDKE